jgi:hypothetical protein
VQCSMKGYNLEGRKDGVGRGREVVVVLHEGNRGVGMGLGEELRKWLKCYMKGYREVGMGLGEGLREWR